MEAPGPAQHDLKPYRSGFLFSFFNSTSWMVVLGAPSVLLAESLGANPFQIGLLYSFVFLLLPIQVIATATLPAFGYKKQVLFAWIARTVFLLIPCGIVFSKPETPNPTLVGMLLLAMFCFCFFRSIGTSAIQPWLFDLLPEKLQARYFSTDMAVISIGGVIALVFCSVTFNWLDTFQAFSVQYVFAILGASLSILGLAKLPSVPNPKSFGPLRILKEGPSLLVKPGKFRQYLLFSLVWIVSGSAVIPFTIYFLRAEGQMPQNMLVLFAALQSAGGVCGALIIKNRIDRIGVRRVFLIIIGLHILIYLFWVVFLSGWMVYPDGIRLMRFFLPVSYFLIGAAGACYFASHLKYLAFVSEKSERALKVSLQTAVVGVATGVASVGWGILFKEPGETQAMNLPAFIGYFIFILLIQLAMIPAIQKLSEPDPSVKPLTNSYGFIRPIRYLATLPVLRRRRRTSSGEINSKVT